MSDNTNGNGLNLICAYHPPQGFGGLSYLIARRMRIDNLMMQEVTLFVKASNLTSIGKARVKGEDTLLAEGCREKKLTEVLGKNLDGFFVSTILAQCVKFVFKARIDKPLKTPSNGSTEI